MHSRDEEVKLIRNHMKTDLKTFQGKFLFLPISSCKKSKREIFKFQIHEIRNRIKNTFKKKQNMLLRDALGSKAAELWL